MVVPITKAEGFFSCAFSLLARKLTQFIKIINIENPVILTNLYSEKPYKLSSIQLNYGGCSLMAERVVVASDFAKLPVALDFERGQEQFTDFVLCEIASKIRKTRVRFSPSTLFSGESKRRGR